MSISNLSTNLPTFNPVYNPLVYAFDSTNKNQTGFRYVVDVYSAGTSTKLFEARVAPRPTDGYGYIDLSKILSSYVSFDLDLTNTTSASIPNSYITYDVKIGEEYITNWSFDDSYFYSGDTKLINTGSTQAHTFVAGDQVIVTLDNPSYFPTLEGLQVVDSVIDSYSFSIELPFVTSPPNAGTVAYADNRKTVYRDLYTYSAHTAFNGAFPFDEWTMYDDANYIQTGTTGTKYLLTNIPDNFYATPDQDIWINYAHFKSSSAYYVYFRNSNGDIFRKTINNTTDNLRQFSAGPNNVGTLTLLSGTAGLVKADTEWYHFNIRTSAGVAVSDTYQINIDNRCKIEDYEILFQDRLGSFSSFAFQLRANENGTITRDSYNRQLGDISGGKWTYDVADAGETITNVNVSKEYTLNTNWMTHEMNVYFQELLTSPITWIKIGTQYYRCTITDTTFEVQSQNFRKLIKRTVKVKLSLQDIINI
jgi:hypothetical protein